MKSEERDVFVDNISSLFTSPDMKVGFFCLPNVTWHLHTEVFTEADLSYGSTSRGAWRKVSWRPKVQIKMELPPKTVPLETSDIDKVKIIQSTFKLIYYGCGALQNVSDVASSFKILETYSCWHLLPKFVKGINNALHESVELSQRACLERFEIINSMIVNEQNREPDWIDKAEHKVGVPRHSHDSFDSYGKVQTSEQLDVKNCADKNKAAIKSNYRTMEVLLEGRVHRAEEKNERLSKLLEIKIDENEKLQAKLNSQKSIFKQNKPSKETKAKLSRKKRKDPRLSPYMSRIEVKQRFQRIEVLLAKINGNLNMLLRAKVTNKHF